MLSRVEAIHTLIKNMTTITGLVLPGHGHGATTGAPTANLDLSLAKNLAPGLYSCQAILENKPVRGLLYYGYNSLTKQDCLEIHFLNFSGDLYGQTITIEIKKFLRPEKKFNSLAKLKQQINKDLKNSPA